MYYRDQAVKYNDNNPVLHVFKFKFVEYSRDVIKKHLKAIEKRQNCPGFVEGPVIFFRISNEWHSLRNLLVLTEVSEPKTLLANDARARINAANPAHICLMRHIIFISEAKCLMFLAYQEIELLCNTAPRFHRGGNYMKDHSFKNTLIFNIIPLRFKKKYSYESDSYQWLTDVQILVNFDIGVLC